MEILPRQRFGWARMHNTRDALIALSSTARKRLVILSPFLDNVGIGWVKELFAVPPVEVLRWSEPSLCAARTHHSENSWKLGSGSVPDAVSMYQYLSLRYRT
jgi:hypothetical protein